MIHPQSRLHLCQQPEYRVKGSVIWRDSFFESVADLTGPATWDLAAILEILSFGYTCGNRTLLTEIERQPWLSRKDANGEVLLEDIPEHGRLWSDSEQIASRLCELLYEEAVEVCKNRKEIYILQSGGLDSRVVTGVLAKLFLKGELVCKPVCVTWGLEGCRDVVYGRKVAEIAGFDWKHIPIGHQNLLANIRSNCPDVGSLVSPVHLHSMDWFKNVSEDAIVLAGSYGDSVGRAEFSGLHILELDYLKPVNLFGLMRKENIDIALEGINSDISQLRQRCEGQPKYAVCECEMQGHYMRNLIEQAMSIIGLNCSLYQMFTHPRVYSFMWSIHPSLRDDKIYVHVLKSLDTKLLSLPWARTNFALSGRTVGAVSGLTKRFHRYKEWLSGPVLAELNSYVDPEWFGATGIFESESVKKVCDYVRGGSDTYGFSPYERWAWLASFKAMADSLKKNSRDAELKTGTGSATKNIDLPQLPGFQDSVLRRLLGKTKGLYSLARTCLTPVRKARKKMRINKLKRRAVKMYPQEKLL